MSGRLRQVLLYTFFFLASVVRFAICSSLQHHSLLLDACLRLQQVVTEFLFKDFSLSIPEMYAFLIILDNGILSLLCNETFSFFSGLRKGPFVLLFI